MKKNIFIILTSTLLILLLIYFYDKTEIIINKKYNNTNIHIEYPYFSNKNIDDYINNYLNSKIKENNNTFIDYDYNTQDNIINLTLYNYNELNNIIDYSTKNLIIDINNYEIKTNNKITNTSYEYYAYTSKPIDLNKPMIALTFNNGPNYNTNKILDILDKYNIKATFFISANNIEDNEQIIKKMNNLNMEIGDYIEKEEDIDKIDKSIYNITNNYPTLIRTNNKKNIKDKPLITWNIDSQDSKFHNSKKISNNILSKIKDGDIILMHDIYSATANSLEITIPKLLEQGYQIVTVSELFHYKNIELKNGNIYSYAK